MCGSDWCLTAGSTDASAARVDRPVGRIVLARPAKLNALNRALLEELADGADWFDDQPEVKVVVVAGEGTASRPDST